MVGALAPAGELRVLGGEDEHVPAGDVHDVGALPHAAEGLVAGHLQFPGEGPAGEGLLRLIHQHAAPLVQRLRAQQDVELLLLFVPHHLRVPLVLAVVVPGAEQRRVQLLRAVVLAQHGGAGVGGAGPVLVPVVAGVEEDQVLPPGDGAAGVGAAVVVIPIRRQADAGVGPVHQVRAGHMIPVLQPVHRAPGTPLVAQVPGALVQREAVGVAGQPGDGLHVPGLPVGRGLGPFVEVPDVLRPLEHAIPLLAGPFLHVRPPLSLVFCCYYHNMKNGEWQEKEGAGVREQGTGNREQGTGIVAAAVEGLPLWGRWHLRSARSK